MKLSFYNSFTFPGLAYVGPEKVIVIEKQTHPNSLFAKGERDSVLQTAWLKTGIASIIKKRER